MGKLIRCRAVKFYKIWEMIAQLIHRSFTAFADGLYAFSRTFGRSAWLVFLAMFSAATVLIFSVPPADAALFKDIQGHWAKSCIAQLAQNKVISGYADGRFRPSEPVTRAEFATAIAKAFPNVADVRSGKNFTDIPSNYWAKEAISKAYQRGFMSGYPENTFKPDDSIQRLEAFLALASGLKYAPTQPAAKTLETAFTDVKDIPNYAQQAIAAATEKQIIVNYPEVKKLNPNKLASRAEIATFLCQAQGTFGLVPAQYVVKANIPTVKPTELRGVWLTNIDSDVLFVREKLTSALQRLRNLNFNTVYPTVWNWGYTLYPSAVAEKTIGTSLFPISSLQGRDILQETIEQGHKNGLAVIPWFEFGFMAPADSELVRRHFSWLTSRRNGDKIWKEGAENRAWLNPFHPDVQQFILDLLGEIASKYDIDGIQLDDHFGLPVEFGYDPVTVALYQKEHNNQLPPENAEDADWIRWRADKITEFMGRVFQTVKASKPKAIVALSPNPWHFSLPQHLQDWSAWEKQGFIEELIVQVYRSDLDRFVAELERPEVQAAKNHIPVGIGILTGLKGKSVSLAQIQEQVKATRDRGLAGVSFFFYESLSNWAAESPAERETAFKNFFPNVVARPNLLAGWKPSS